MIYNMFDHSQINVQFEEIVWKVKCIPGLSPKQMVWPDALFLQDMLRAGLRSAVFFPGGPA